MAEDNSQIELLHKLSDCAERTAWNKIKKTAN
jgi:hypothetical protein